MAVWGVGVCGCDLTSIPQHICVLNKYGIEKYKQDRIASPSPDTTD